MTQPLFILCPGRSFSSVVCAAVGQHPGAYGLPEVNLFLRPTLGALADLDVPLLGLPGALTGLKRTVAELAFGAQTEDTVRQASAWIAERKAWSGKQVLDALSEMAGSRMIVDKTPTNSQAKSLRILHAAYPDAFYLHLARHPRATTRSRFNAFEKQRQSGKRKGARLPGRLGPDEAEQVWLTRHEELLEFGRAAQPGQYMYLRGETFFEDPVPVLRQICEWVGLSADEAAIAAMLRPEDSPFAVEGPPSARFGNNPGFIENPRLRIGKIKPDNLDAPLEWVEGREAHFATDTRDLAALMGYGD